MKPFDMTGGKAEAELLELIHQPEAKHFTLTMTCADGHWTIAMEELGGQAGRLVGESDSFPCAWFSTRPKPGGSST